MSIQNTCAARESNPGRKNGNLAWYHYTSGAIWRCRGSNPGPFTCEANALPLSHIPKFPSMYHFIKPICRSQLKVFLWRKLYISCLNPDNFQNNLEQENSVNYTLIFCQQIHTKSTLARLAQSVEHGTLNPRVVGSSPTLGAGILTTIECEILVDDTGTQVSPK